ncbi:capsule assembly Wzi family protein [Geothrix paludis]|uniref:capsule assembly Wzi family protein n=1 Tax=Geothrix paludis TaxID=2922722 RepID=UPI001FACCAB4
MRYDRLALNLSCLLAGLPLAAQMPPGWSRQEPLGAGRQGAWYGGGVWAGDKHSAPATFVDSLGLGNALTGQGTHLEAGWSGARWDLAGQINAWRDAEGQSRIIVQRFHIAYASAGGWRTALEQEPLVWGYGLNGGYVLGEAARPFPRFRVESPFTDIRVFGVPLGTWKGQIFLGQVEGHKVIGESSQDPSYRQRAIADMGDPQRPFLSGLRLESQLGESTELYINYINLFGGSVQGRSLTEGYQARHWIASFFGLKDSYAEGGVGLNGSSSFLSTGRVKSASTSDVGVRIRLNILERLFEAEDVRFYVSRGSKAVNTRMQWLIHRPGTAFRKDLRNDWISLTQAPFRPWNQRSRYVLPSPAVPNDAVGLLVNWGRVRLGVEYLDTANSLLNPDNPGLTNHRTFEQDTYLSGFYQEGDPLGNATAGEARTVTLRAEIDWTPRWATRTWLLGGDRPFRESIYGTDRPYQDGLADWLLDHPGAMPVRNRFLGLQQVVVWRPDPVLRVQAGVSTQRQNAYLNVKGDARTGFRWFIDLGWTWPRR